MSIEKSIEKLADALFAIADAMTQQPFQGTHNPGGFAITDAMTQNAQAPIVKDSEWKMVKTSDATKSPQPEPEPENVKNEVDPEQHFTPPSKKTAAKKTVAKKNGVKKDITEVPLEEVHKALQKILDEYGKDGAIQYLAHFKAVKISDIPESQYADFVQGADMASEILD